MLMSVHGLNVIAGCVYHEYSLQFGPIYIHITEMTLLTHFPPI